jgi:hypothetical protein
LDIDEPPSPSDTPDTVEETTAGDNDSCIQAADQSGSIGAPSDETSNLKPISIDILDNPTVDGKMEDLVPRKVNYSGHDLNNKTTHNHHASSKNIRKKSKVLLHRHYVEGNTESGSQSESEPLTTTENQQTEKNEISV